ncbi:hypothetical protein PMAYCL1PPCAC_26513, partial [Pristionchus mayeri]
VLDEEHVDTHCAGDPVRLGQHEVFTISSSPIALAQNARIFLLEDGEQEDEGDGVDYAHSEGGDRKHVEVEDAHGESVPDRSEHHL